MKAIILSDNISNNGLKGEWGLSILITYNNKNILLDVGSSDLFYQNGERLDVDIKTVDYAVLSHAHYDHSRGMREFFKQNTNAKFYVREGCEENCYCKYGIFRKYIGIPKGILSEQRERIIFAAHDYALMPGVTLIPHKGKELKAIGKANHMYVREGRKFRPDGFTHEQSLVFDTSEGLVIFNSCSHGGVIQIIKEVQETFKGKKIKAYVGGFHIYNKSKAEVRELAQQIKDTGIETVYTGHCTGDKSFGVLKEVLGSSVKQFHVGLEMTF
ncbi:MAG: MBL fold metallo-hydrolase [bacterium]|nr:MBL fold metallo-hydrolase [bacterium]